MVLVNGADGIGTGWSTSIPNYSPLDIIANIRLFLRRKKMKVMVPWYQGFTGTIKKSAEKGKYDCLGVWQESARGGSLEITELPLRKWTQDYKEFLQGMLPGSDKKTKVGVQDIREYHTENKVHFVLRMTIQEVKAAKAEGIADALRLRGSINETNL